MAGLGEVCSHIGALLFYLESASRVSKSCTQIGCVRKEPRVVESIPYAEIAVIPFEKPKSQIEGCKRGAHLYSDTIPLADLQLVEGTEMVLEEVMLTEDIASNELPSTVDTPSSSGSLMQLLRVSPSNEEQMEFLSKKSKHKPVICSIVSPYSDAFKPKSETSNLPSSLSDLYQPQNEEITYSELLEVCEQMVINVDNEEVTKIEMFTCDQNKSSSNLSVLLILVILPKVSLSEYFIQILQNSRWAATAWGCEDEFSAKIAYIRLMKSNHTDFSCKESGLVVSLNHPFQCQS